MLHGNFLFFFLGLEREIERKFEHHRVLRLAEDSFERRVEQKGIKTITLIK
jgi:hypothetical protein